MNTLLDIRKSLRAQKEYLFEKYPIKSLAIFGSYARNEPSENSDLDLMVEFHEAIGSQFIQLGDELEDYFGIRVDLVSRRGIKDRYFEYIKSELIYV